MHLYKQEVHAPVGLTDSPLLGANPYRVGLIISAPLTNRFTISFSEGVAVLDGGITLYPGATPLFLPPDPRQCWLTEPIRAISAVAPQVVNIVEIMEMQEQ
jgi:hypothetical protein